jgi:hypothetical protein
MGILFSLPLAGVLGTVGSSCLAGLAFCFTSTAGLSFLTLDMSYTDRLPFRIDSVDVLQVLQLQLLYRNSHGLRCTILQ